MGFESFQIKLEGGTKTSSEAISAIRSLGNAVPDDESMMMPGSAYFLLKDGRHAIEMEVMDAPMRISCRFTLCHPSSVDAVFFDLARRLMALLDMRVTICDDVPPEHETPFTLDRIEEFTKAASACLTVRRAEWQGAFGMRQLGATTNEVHQHIILPQCQAYVDKAG
jgi:hypothetical protein